MLWPPETICKKDIKTNGICAFDIDGTCLEGKNNLCYYNGKIYDKTNGGCTAAAIQACIDKKYLLAVNTASYRHRNKFCCKVGLCDKNGKCFFIYHKKCWYDFQ